jgi:hypothetical protein
MTTVIDRATYDRIADDLAVLACSKGDPTESDHDHAVCLDVPGALLADHLWRIVAPLADGNGKAARVAVRRLDQAMGAGEIR